MIGCEDCLYMYLTELGGALRGVSQFTIVIRSMVFDVGVFSVDFVYICQVV